MSPVIVRAFGAILMIWGALLSIAVTSVHALFLPAQCPTGFANFGDSLTDTGNNLVALPFLPDPVDPENPPYGESFFGKPAKRYSNGRLVPDFFSQAFGFPLLDGYLAVASFNYKNGINFANAGATAAFSETALSPFSVYPFQTGQFIRFKNSVSGTEAQIFGLGCLTFNQNLPQINLLTPNPLSTWLYTINAGANDLLRATELGVPINIINTTVLQGAVIAIKTAITVLYENGARQFLIFGLPNTGCSTVILALSQGLGLPTDSLGCINASNSVSQNFNSQLLAQIQVLRTTLPGANIAFFDYFAASTAILTSPATYGFNPAVTKEACCGTGGPPYNFNIAETCGNPGVTTACANPDTYISWDGFHYTENFYRTIAEFALNGLFTNGGVNYAALCNLDFSKFDSGVTFQQAYPFQSCNNLFA